MSRTCIYPGTFDPVTFGHIDVIARASRLFDRIVVAVAENPGKSPLFTADERVELIRGNLEPFENVTAIKFYGLTIDLANELGACALIRGLRALTDFEFEFQMALMNRHLAPEIETIFVMTKDAYSYTSSCLIKQVSHYGADIKKFVPPNVCQALETRQSKDGGTDVNEDH